MNTLLSDKHKVVRRSARAFCEREIAPIAAEIDQEARFPWDVAEKMGEVGFMGIQVPAELGGAGMDSLSAAVAVEEISRASASLGLCVSVHNGVVLHPLLTFGSEEQKRRWVPDLARGKKIGAFCLTEPNAGSDAGSIEASAVLGGDCYVVNANKVFVTNGGAADVFLLFVRTAGPDGKRRASVLVAERGMEGLSVGENEDLCGMRANPVSSVRLFDCKIPVANLLGGDGMGIKIGLSGLDAGRIGIGAQSVGIAQAAFEEATRYAKQRRQFGVAIARHQSVQNMVADMACQLEAARLMVYRAAILRDRGKNFTQAAAMAKLFASEACCKVTDMALQIHGGYGYSKSYAVERLYRDARVTRIYEGASEIQRMVIARSVLS